MDQINSLGTNQKFKKTEIGDIPVDWEVVNLGDIAQITMGQSPPSTACYDYENGIPFFQGKAEFGAKYPKVIKWCNSPKKIAEKNDILVCVRAPVGDVNIAPEKCCIGRGLAAIHGTKSDNGYLYFVMNYLKNMLIKTSQGSTFEAINKNALFEFKIPFAPLPEQKKIADILSTIDNEIEDKEAQIKRLESIKSGLMQVLLTGRKRVRI